MPVKTGSHLSAGPSPQNRLLGLPRVVSTDADVRALLAVAPSAHNGLTFCVGSYGSNAANDVEAMAGAFGLEAEEMRRHPHALFGSPEEIAEELLRRREAYGISYVTVSDPALEAFAPVVAQLTGR